jgi:hypothetical protein
MAAAAAALPLVVSPEVVRLFFNEEAVLDR